MLRSEVGRAHGRVGLHLGRGAACEQRAKFHHHQLIADVHHQVHVVLDQQDAHALGLQLTQHSGESQLFFVTQTGGGLI